MDVSAELRGYAKLPPGINADGDGILRTRLQLVLKKEQGDWRVAAYHNVAILPLPAPR